MLEILRNLLYIKISYHSDCTMILIDFNILQQKFTNRALKRFIKAPRNVKGGNRTNSTLQKQGVSNNSVYKTRGLSVICRLRAKPF